MSTDRGCLYYTVRSPLRKLEVDLYQFKTRITVVSILKVQWITKQNFAKPQTRKSKLMQPDSLFALLTFRDNPL